MPWPSIWPFTSRQDEKRSSSIDEFKQTASTTINAALPKPEDVPDSVSDLRERLQKNNWSSFTNPATIVSTVILTSGLLIGRRFYKRRLRRISDAESIPTKKLRKDSIFGRVTSVGDGDNFHLYHTPGGKWAGWGWFPGRKVPTDSKALKGNTIHTRLAGVDAPELAHFGRPAQPYGQEALDWLTTRLLHQNVRIYPYRKDQYKRVVAGVYARKWGMWSDVSAEMLRAGVATIYEAKFGSEFGRKEALYRRLEKKASDRGIGLWKEPGILQKLFGGEKAANETPREFKNRMKELEAKKEGTKG